MLRHLRRALSRHHDDLQFPYHPDLASSRSPFPSGHSRSSESTRPRIIPFPPGRYTTTPPSSNSYRNRLSEDAVEREELQELEVLYAAVNVNYPGEFRTAVRELVRREMDAQRRMWRRTELELDEELSEELAGNRDGSENGGLIGNWDWGYGVGSVFGTRSSVASDGSLDGTSASELWQAGETLSTFPTLSEVHPEAPPPYRPHHVSASSQLSVERLSPVLFENPDDGDAPSYHSAGFARPAVQLHGLDDQQQPLSPAPGYTSIEGSLLDVAPSGAQHYSSSLSSLSRPSSLYSASTRSTTSLSSRSDHSPAFHSRASTFWSPAMLSSQSSAERSFEYPRSFSGLVPLRRAVSQASSGKQSIGSSVHLSSRSSLSLESSVY
ncbi:hypothetical protein IAR50_006263 [Cryptococcus sp. DSM 104548]